MSLYEILFNNNKNKNIEFGDARFMNWSEERHFFSRNTINGYRLDGKQYLREKHLPTHCMTIASTGSGKSVVLTGHLLSLTKKDRVSCVVVDPSGEIQQTTQGWLKKQGYVIKSLNLNDTSKSKQFNPLKRALLQENGIQETVELLIDGEKDFWSLSARSRVENVLEALLNKNQDEYPKNLASVLKIIHLMSVSPDVINEFMAKYLPEDKYLEYASFLAIDSKVRNNILATVKASLGKLTSKTISYITEKDSIEIEKLRKEKTVLFISAREDKVRKYFGFLLNLFVTQLLEYALEMPEKEDLNLHFFLDEFATFNLGRESFPEVLPILRRRRTACFMYLQDISQLEQNYGSSGAKIVLANALNKIIFGKASIEVSRYVESLLGTTTKEVNGSLRPMPLLSGQEIRGLKQWEFLYLNGSHFKKMKVKPWFKSNLKRRANL